MTDSFVFLPFHPPFLPFPPGLVGGGVPMVLSGMLFLGTRLSARSVGVFPVILVGRSCPCPGGPGLGASQSPTRCPGAALTLRSGAPCVRPLLEGVPSVGPTEQFHEEAPSKVYPPLGPVLPKWRDSPPTEASVRLLLTVPSLPSPQPGSHSLAL